MERKKIVAAADLLAVGMSTDVPCMSTVRVKDDDPLVGVGRRWVLDRDLSVRIPKHLWEHFGARRVIVKMHELWHYHNTDDVYRSLVVDETDYAIYDLTVVQIESEDDRFTVASRTLQDISKLATDINPYLAEIVELAQTDPPKLLEYQVFSAFTQGYEYMEMPVEGKVIMCGIGLNDNSFVKDFAITYAECTPQAYVELQKQMPSLYNRARLMHTYQDRLIYYKYAVEKRKKHKELMDLLFNENDGGPSTKRISRFFAFPHGVRMIEYKGPACARREKLLRECQRIFGNPSQQNPK